MFQIEIADLVIEIHHQFPYVERQCRNWRLDPVTEKPDMVVCVGKEQIRQELLKAEVPVSDGYCESICLYREIAKRLTDFSAFLMHGAVVELDGEAYVFTAKSGVGKTTHTRLWIEYFHGRAEYINGDKPVMRWKDGRLYAYGTPWMGKEGYGKPGGAPVKAVCFLERGEENRICPADSRQIVSRLFHQVLLPEDPSELALFLDMIDRMAGSIPFYILRCDISMEAVRIAYGAMSGDNAVLGEAQR